MNFRIAILLLIAVHVAGVNGQPQKLRKNRKQNRKRRSRGSIRSTTNSSPAVTTSSTPNPAISNGIAPNPVVNNGIDPEPAVNSGIQPNSVGNSIDSSDSDDGGGNFGDAPLVMEPGDLNIRFNKIPTLAGGSYVDQMKPLTNTAYPIRGRLAEEMKRFTTAESVMTADDFELKKVDEVHYMQLAGGAPTYPNADPNHEFWQKDFRVVVESQVARRANESPSNLMTLPNLWEGYNLDQVAEAVHDEYPGYHQSQLLAQLISEDVKIDYSILPFRCFDDFIGLEFRMAHLNTWATMQVAPTNFRTKWTFGRPRPEEVAWLVTTGEIPAESVPADLRETILGWQLQGPTDFTSYQEGSPRHPSYPAMHSAASSASLWMAVVFDLTPAQYCQVQLTDWSVSYARTVAGVHYPTDNTAGLNMGQELVAVRLAEYLSKEYGANKAAVQSKIDRLRFDWKNFDHHSCR